MPRDFTIGSAQNIPTSAVFNLLRFKAENVLSGYKDYCNFSVSSPHNIALDEVIKAFDLKYYFARNPYIRVYYNRCSRIHKISYFAFNGKRVVLDPNISCIRFGLRPFIRHLTRFRSYSDVCRNDFDRPFSSTVCSSSCYLIRDIMSQPNGLITLGSVAMIRSTIFSLRREVKMQLLDTEHAPASVLNAFALAVTKSRDRRVARAKSRWEASDARA